MRKLLLSVFILLSLITFSYAEDYVTTHYRMLVPEEASHDWNAKISGDIISIDTIMFILSQDSSFVNVGANSYTRNPSEKVGIGYSAPLVSLDVNGAISADCLRFDSQSTSPDTSTLKGPILVVSKDITGSIDLNFWNGSVWKKLN